MGPSNDGGDRSPGQGPPGTPHDAARTRGSKAIVASVLLVLLVVFVIRNSQPVRLDFVVVSGHPRLIWLIVGCILIGGAVGYFLGRPGKPRRPKPADRGPV